MISQKLAKGEITSTLVNDTVATLMDGKVQALMANGEDMMAGITLAPGSTQEAGMPLPWISANPLFMIAFISLFTVAGTMAEDAKIGVFNWLWGISRASSDDDEFPPFIVPGIADFAGSPNPEDFCKNFGRGSTVPPMSGPSKYGAGGPFAKVQKCHPNTTDR